MKRFIMALLAAISVGTSPALAALRIVTTTPELADITRRIGGNLVQVESLAKGTEDIHNIPQRPSFLPKLNQADAVVLVGLELEHTFLPALSDVAQNPKILRDREGYIDCSDGVNRLEAPTNFSRAQGELHPLGNPHYNMDPRYGGLMADNITKGLIRIDPAHQETYEKNREVFKKEWETKLTEWQAMAAPAKGVKAVSHHKDMTYFGDFLGLQLVGMVELKPGIPPTPTHLEELAIKMKQQKVPLLIREIQFPDQTARWLAQQTGARIAPIATMGGAFSDSHTYFGFVEHNIRSVVDALK